MPAAAGAAHLVACALLLVVVSGGAVQDPPSAPATLEIVDNVVHVYSEDVITRTSDQEIRVSEFVNNQSVSELSAAAKTEAIDAAASAADTAIEDAFNAADIDGKIREAISALDVAVGGEGRAPSDTVQSNKAAIAKAQTDAIAAAATAADVAIASAIADAGIETKISNAVSASEMKLGGEGLAPGVTIRSTKANVDQLSTNFSTRVQLLTQSIQNAKDSAILIAKGNAATITATALSAAKGDFEGEIDQMKNDLEADIVKNTQDLTALLSGAGDLTIAGNADRLDALEPAVDTAKALSDTNKANIEDLEDKITTLIGDLSGDSIHPDISNTLAAEVANVKATTNEATILAQNAYTKTDADAKFLTKDCSVLTKNSLRLSDTDEVEYCDGSEWVKSNAGSGANTLILPNGCSQVFADGDSIGDGIYNVKVNGAAARHYCYMSKGGLSLGGDGSNAANAGYSCGTIRARFSSAALSDKSYWVNGDINSNDGGVAKQVTCTMSNAQAIDPGDDGSSSSRPAPSCAVIKEFHPLNAGSGSYWLKAPGQPSAELTYCDMETQGGGWTLVFKLPGLDQQMNGKNTANWRDGNTRGNLGTLGVENALGLGYSYQKFSEVMVQALSDPKKSLGWRHGGVQKPIRDIVRGCSRIDDGQKFFGSIFTLDHPIGTNPLEYHGCTEMKYGFLLGDDSQTNYGLLGCPTGSPPTGHTGGVLGGAVINANLYSYGTHDDTHRYCITNFAMGGGYGSLSNLEDSYSINAHWWGNGNAQVFAWGAHGAFVRQPISVFGGGDGSTPYAAGMSCGSLKALGITKSINWVMANGKPILGACDFTSTPPTFLGGDGSTIQTAGHSCATIKANFPAKAQNSGAYYLLDPDVGATQVYCDQTTDGGGWTMVAVAGQDDATMNGNNIAAWHDGVPTGNAAVFASTNVLTHAYSTVDFDDVMIMGATHHDRRVGWRHPASYTSMRDVTRACNKIDTGVLLFGGIDNLDSGQNTWYYNACRKLKYGFLLGDDGQTGSTIAGCPKSKVPHGHAGGVVGASFPPNVPGVDYGKDDGDYRRCISNFGIGGGYSSISQTSNDGYAINSHWWGDGNEKTYAWGAHGVFVRKSGSYLRGGDGSADYPGSSCDQVKTDHGKSGQVLTWLLLDGARSASDKIYVNCDHSQIPSVNLGNDGSAPSKPGTSCKRLKAMGKTTSQAYYVIGLHGLGTLTYCDMTTEGGGWTMVAKVLGNDPTLNSRNTHAWRQGRTQGNTATISPENAIGEQYSVTPFTDVMIFSLSSASLQSTLGRLGWRHPSEFKNMRSIAVSCAKIENGVRLFGSVYDLDHPVNDRYRDCTNMRYGFFLGDNFQENSHAVGCWGTNYGHAGGFISIATPEACTSGTGTCINCMSNFGVGGGYSGTGGGNDGYAINAHWWGNGNEDVYNFDAVAVYVR